MYKLVTFLTVTKLVWCLKFAMLELYFLCEIQLLLERLDLLIYTLRFCQHHLCKIKASLIYSFNRVNFIS